MNRVHIDAILSGQQPLGVKPQAERPVIVLTGEMRSCVPAVQMLCTHRTGARPLVLESPQLPPIF